MSADRLHANLTDEFRRVVPGLGDDELDFDADMVDRYGLTSLNKVVFLSSACTTANVSLAAFTELDLAELRTLTDVAAALYARGGEPSVAR
jgi:hypothetical protein